MLLHTRTLYSASLFHVKQANRFIHCDLLSMFILCVYSLAHRVRRTDSWTTCWQSSSCHVHKEIPIQFQEEISIK